MAVLAGGKVAYEGQTYDSLSAVAARDHRRTVERPPVLWNEGPCVKGEPAKPKCIRCAIYTRKSSEEGLEQSFNSLDAQREAGEAYIRSQADEGWVTIPASYDDGGFSGGSMERPALKALLADIAAGKIDVVLVYKIDRLTRSLTDFSRIVEVFDKAGASFVSITQSFNTTSSMGRLTLNVLLSFAQFEREVTGERIRDKIAASKAKGLWMGGVCPIGYDAKDHVLLINEIEAPLVRRVFRRYLEIGSVHRLKDELEREGIRSKRWTTVKGKPMGGVVLERGALYHLLRNRHYLGEILHGDLSYPGLHQPIIDRALFEAVQARLTENAARGGATAKTLTEPPARLVGRLFDAEGDPMSPSRSRGKGGRYYTYYVSSCLQLGAAPADAPSLGPRRLPSEPLEYWVDKRLRRLAGRPEDEWGALSSLLLRVDVMPAATEFLIDLDKLAGRGHRELALSALQRRLDPGEEAVIETGNADVVRVRMPGRLQFRGGKRGVAQEAVPVREPDPIIIGKLRRAHVIASEIGADPLTGFEALTATAAPPDAYERALCRLAFLAPDLQMALLEGRQPYGVSVQRLIAADLPLRWEAQRKWWWQLR